MGLQVCTAAEQALLELNQRRFHAVIIDCDDVDAAPDVLRSLRGNPGNRRSTTFAILNGVTTMRGAFDMGASLTLQKPISLDHARKSMRALKGLVEQEHRKYHRVPVDFPVTIIFDEQQEFQAVAANLSESGMAVRLPNPVPPHRTVAIRFVLPGGTNRIEAKATVAWSDVRGNAGLRFDYMSPGAKHELTLWIAHNTDKPKKEPVHAHEQPVRKSVL